MRINQYTAAPTRVNRRKRARKYLKIIFLIIVVGLLSVGGWFFRYGAFFQVQSLTLTGVDERDREAVLESMHEWVAHRSVMNRLLGSTHYLAWPSDVREVTFPTIADIAIEKNFVARSISVDATLRDPYGIWCTTQETPMCYWFDADESVIMSEASFSEGQLVHRVSEDVEIIPSPGMTLFSEDELIAIKTILFEMRGLQFPIDDVRVERDLQELHVIASNGAELWFSLRNTPPPSLFDGLKIILNETPISRIDYVNATVPRKVYVQER